jgi:iron(III) transport system substrate-binding protein
MVSILRILGVILLALAIPVAGWAADMGAIQRAANKEGTVTWYSNSKKKVNQKVAKVWKKAYPKIKLRHVRKGTGNQVPTVEAERMAKKVRVDVMNHTDPATFLRWGREGFLASFNAPNDKKLPAEFVDKDHYYRAVSIYLHPGVYNTKKVKAGDVPKKLSDMVKKKYKGLTVSATPRTSGVEFPKYLTAVNRYGWEFVKGLADNDHLLQKGQGAVLRMVLKGERPIGVGNTSYRIWGAMKKGRALKPIFYEDGTVMITVNLGTPKAAPHPNAARLLINFLISKKIQKLMVKNHFYSARGDVGKPKLAPALSSLKILKADNEQLIKARGPFFDKFDSYFGMK